jgi:Phytanoyl-CoA dioxygenase (PhyH)
MQSGRWSVISGSGIGDFVYRQREDEMPRPHALTAAVFLDDVTDSGGPILVIPGTQKLGDDHPDPDISRGDSSDLRLPKWAFSYGQAYEVRFAGAVGSTTDLGS